MQTNFEFANHKVMEIIRPRSADGEGTPFAVIVEKFEDPDFYPQNSIEPGKTAAQMAQIATSYLSRKKRIEKSRSGLFFVAGQVPKGSEKRRHRKRRGQDGRDEDDSQKAAELIRPTKIIHAYPADKISRIILLDHGKAKARIKTTGKAVTITIEEPAEKEPQQSAEAIP